MDSSNSIHRVHWGKILSSKLAFCSISFSGNGLAGWDSENKENFVLSQILCDEDLMVSDFPGQKLSKNIINRGIGLQRKVVECSTWVTIVYYS